LEHCRSPQCVMFFSKSLIDTDTKGPDFCPKCKNKISRSLL
jgi:archaemetzincin